MKRFRPIVAPLILALTLLIAAARPAVAQDAPTQTAWIGVRITPVPAPLAAHLPLGRTDKNPDVGVMVLNIVADGPAEKAGLKQYDVIVALGDEPITGDFGPFVRALGKYKPGDKARLTVVRADRRITLNIEMAAAQPALQAQYSYRYPEQPDGVFAQRSDFRGAILTRHGDDWQWQDFGEAGPALFADLPEDVRDRVMKWTGSIAPVNRTTINQGRRTTELAQNPDGSITVKTALRLAGGSQQSASRTYASDQVLREENPAAFEMYQRILADPALQSPAVLTASDNNPAPAAAFAPPADPRAQEATRLLGEAEAYQNEIREYEKFLEQYTEYLRRKLEQPDRQPLPDDVREKLDQAVPDFIPEREFKLHPDGRIDVRIRRPDGDLVISFRSEDELKSEYPKLHQQYRRLIDDQSR